MIGLYALIVRRFISFPCAMGCRLPCLSLASSPKAWLGAIGAIGSPRAAALPSTETVRYDENVVPAAAFVRGFRRRRWLALSGAARNPLVLVSNLARAAGRARPGQPLDRRAAGGHHARPGTAAEIGRAHV